jgi:uncharacterized protein (DUF302 family)
MIDYGRRIVIDWGFEAAVSAANRAIRDEKMQTIARIDVRRSFRRDLGRDFRRYVMLEARSPDLAFEAIRNDLDAGTIFPATFAIYDLADGETAVMVKTPIAAIAVHSDDIRPASRVRRSVTERVARVLERLQRHHQAETAARGRRGAPSADTSAAA